MSYHSQYAKKPCIYHKQPIFFFLTPLIIVGVTKGVIKRSHLTGCESFKLRCWGDGSRWRHGSPQGLKGNPRYSFRLSPNFTEKSLQCCNFLPFSLQCLQPCPPFSLLPLLPPRALELLLSLSFLPLFLVMYLFIIIMCPRSLRSLFST